MNAISESLTHVAKPNGRPKTASRSRRLLAVEHMEERTLLSASPIRIGSLGDSLTDEYAFYAPYRPAGQNWVQILSGLRGPQATNQLTFGAYSATVTQGETRNYGYAQNWVQAAPPRSGTTSSER